MNPTSTTDATPERNLRAWTLAAAVFLPLMAAYAVTADYSGNYHNDTLTNSLTGWALGTNGTVYVDEIADVDLEATWAKVWWFSRSEGGPISVYPPGTAMLVAPIYALTRPELETVRAEYEPIGGNGVVLEADLALPPMWPGALVGAGTTAIAMTLFAFGIRDSARSDRQAVHAALVAGLGTTAWSVSSDSLWQHGPAMMWVGLGFLLTSIRPSIGGLAYGAAVFTRPQVAPIAAAVGIAAAWRRRSWATLVAFGLAAGSGLVAFFWFMQVHFGAWYAPKVGFFFENLGSGGLWSYLGGVALSAIDPRRGFLIWSPFLILLIPGLRVAWREASPVTRSAALGGLAYFLVMIKGNVWHGGLGHFTYRYPLEMLYAAGPLLFLSYRNWVFPRPRASRIFRVLMAVSMVAHGVGAWLY